MNCKHDGVHARFEEAKKCMAFASCSCAQTLLSLYFLGSEDSRSRISLTDSARLPSSPTRGHTCCVVVVVVVVIHPSIPTRPSIQFLDSRGPHAPHVRFVQEPVDLRTKEAKAEGMRTSRTKGKIEDTSVWGGIGGSTVEFRCCWWSNCPFSSYTRRYRRCVPSGETSDAEHRQCRSSAAHRGKYFLFMVRAGAATILSAIAGKTEVEKETA